MLILPTFHVVLYFFSRLRIRPLSAGRQHGGHALRFPDVHGPRGHHEPAVQLQGRPLVPRHHRVPVPLRKSAFSSHHASGAQTILREKFQPCTKVSHWPDRVLSWPLKTLTFLALIISTTLTRFQTTHPLELCVGQPHESRNVE